MNAVPNMAVVKREAALLMKKRRYCEVEALWMN
jgi:hypothetical protein